MKRLCLPLGAAALALAAGTAPAGDPAPDELPQGMALFPATDKQRMGIDEKPLRVLVEKELQSKLLEKDNWDAVWNQVLLLCTPAHVTSVGEFALSKFEVTNAQWEVFIQDEMNQFEFPTGAGTTLGGMVSEIYAIDRDSEGARHQRAWKDVLARNAEVLMPALNPKGEADWDPDMKQAADLPLPAGLKLKFARYLPLPHWTGRKIPLEERSRPARGVSWAAAMDFCVWAGFHLPSEQEWERAARGDEARRFPWGDAWSPYRALWSGYNRAIEDAAKADTGEPLPEPVGPKGSPPPYPVKVDDTRFASGATPEGVMHLAGNVSEWVVNRAYKYPGTKATFYFEGQSLLARGGNYQDDVAFINAFDRMWDGKLGAILPSHEMEGVGLRTAMYPRPGMDLALPASMLYDRTASLSGPAWWFPTPPGLSKDQRNSAPKARPFQGVALEASVGILKRQLAVGPVEDHVYVTGRAKGVSLLPVKGLPAGVVKGSSDFPKLTERSADKPEKEVILLGVLLGTPGLKFKLRETVVEVARTGAVAPDKDDGKGKGKGKGKSKDAEPPAPQAKELEVAFDDDRFYWDGEYTGAFLVLHDDRVAVFAPNPGQVGKPDLHLAGTPIGYLEAPWTGGTHDKAEDIAEGAVLEGSVLTMTVALPNLDNSGMRPKVTKTTRQVQVTIRVPVVGF